MFIQFIALDHILSNYQCYIVNVRISVVYANVTIKETSVYQIIICTCSFKISELSSWFVNLVVFIFIKLLGDFVNGFFTLILHVYYVIGCSFSLLIWYILIKNIKIKILIQEHINIKILIFGKKKIIPMNPSPPLGSFVIQDHKLLIGIRPRKN